MNWAAFYLACFVIGLALTLISLVAGSVHLHIPHLHFGDGHGIGHAHGHGISMRGAGPHGAHAQVPVINASTILAFLAWFGATGYLLTHFHPVKIVIGLIAASLGGLTGGGIVFWFLAKLMQYDNTMQSADYDMVGVLGKLSVSIRAGGTGEIIYSQMGRRFCGAARSEDGGAIAKGTEVVVTRHERGVAYVKPWDELAGAVEENGASRSESLQ